MRVLINSFRILL